MEKIKDFLNEIESHISVILLVAMLVILFKQVVLRYVFNNANAWSEELARYMFIWFTYLSASVCVLKNRHIRIDTLINVWPKVLRPFIVITGNLIFLAYCVVTAYYGAIFTQVLIGTGRISLGLQMPMWIVFAVIPVCNTAMAIRLIQNMVNQLRTPKEA